MNKLFILFFLLSFIPELSKADISRTEHQLNAKDFASGKIVLTKCGELYTSGTTHTDPISGEIGDDYELDTRAMNSTLAMKSSGGAQYCIYEGVNCRANDEYWMSISAVCKLESGSQCSGEVGAISKCANYKLSNKERGEIFFTSAKKAFSKDGEKSAGAVK